MTNVHAIEIKPEKQERAEYKKLIMEGDDFSVVIDNDGDIYWETTKDYNWENVDDKDIVKFNQILNKVAELEVVCESSVEFENYKHMTAEGIARALDRDLGSAIEMLNACERIIRENLLIEIVCIIFWQAYVLLSRHL